MTKPTPIYRCDLFAQAGNRGKLTYIDELFGDWHTIAVKTKNRQLRLFHQKGQFNKNLKPTKKEKNKTLPVAYQQMVQYQVVGMLTSWFSNRQNEFREFVQQSNLSKELKHQLHIINLKKAWFWTKTKPAKKGKAKVNKGKKKVKQLKISPEVYLLARKIFKHLCRRHHLPDFSQVNMIIDQRCVEVSDNKHSKSFTKWLKLSTLNKGNPIQIPLFANPHYEQRQGNRAKSVQVNQVEINGRKTYQIGLLTDVADVFRQSKNAYQVKTDVIGIDIGLRNLFATDQGDLLGRDWLDKLLVYNRKIDKLGSYRQQHGLKTSSPRYQRYVQALRGFITSEVNRHLNHLIELYQPGVICVEKLHFHSPDLSKRLNRLLSWFGKRAITSKLQALSEQYGIIIDYVNPAYSSQECSKCHYVDKQNRSTQANFTCKWCHSHLHADVNGARVVSSRRSTASNNHSLPLSRQQILDGLVNQHMERFTRLLAKPADPRLKNPYFRKVLPRLTSIANNS